MGQGGSRRCNGAPRQDAAQIIGGGRNGTSRSSLGSLLGAVPGDREQRPSPRDPRATGGGGRRNGRTPCARTRARGRGAGASRGIGARPPVLVPVLSPICLGQGLQPGTVAAATTGASPAVAHASPPHPPSARRRGGWLSEAAKKRVPKCHRDAPSPGTAGAWQLPLFQTPGMEKPLPCSSDGTERQDRPSPGTSNWSNWFSWGKVEHGESQRLKPVPRCV